MAGENQYVAVLSSISSSKNPDVTEQWWQHWRRKRGWRGAELCRQVSRMLTGFISMVM